MALAEKPQVRRCFYCEKDTMHDVFKSVKYFENPLNSTKGTYVFGYEYTCRICKISTKV